MKQRRSNTQISHHENGRLKVTSINTEPSKTFGQFKDQCDVNLILKKYPRRTIEGYLREPVNPGYGQYIDLSQIQDFQTSLDTVIKANDSFMALPSEIRKRFGNDPHELVEFLSDPKNNEEAIKFGLKQKTPQPIQNQILTELKNQTKNQTQTKTSKTES